MSLEDAKKKAAEQRGETDIERRVYAADKLAVEKRADDEPQVLVGHAAVFNQEVDIGGWFIERVAPGAFKRAIGEDDVRALFNHDSNYVLGRNTAKTLELREDETGLWDKIILPATTFARDLVVLVERGDITQQSFAFRVLKEQWEERGHDFVRTILEVKLYDVSPVTYPAYQTTDIGVRSLEAFKAQRAEGLTTRSPGLVRREAIQRTRARLR